MTDSIGNNISAYDLVGMSGQKFIGTFKKQVILRIKRIRQIERVIAGNADIVIPARAGIGRFEITAIFIIF